MTRIRAMIAEWQGEKIEFVRCLPVVKTEDPLRDLKARSAVASSLIAVLELVRGGDVIATQTERQGSIVLN